MLQGLKYQAVFGNVLSLATLLALACAILLNSNPVQADGIPAMPSVYYGTVRNNGSIVGSGFIVEVRINNTVVAVGTTDAQGRYGYSPNPEFSFTCSSGTAYFYVNGIQAVTVPCTQGVIQLDLSVTGAPLTYTAPVVASNSCSITTTTLPSAIIGTAYSATLSATGGSGTYTWSVASGSLPAGLSLNANTISGTPTTAGSYTFTIQVADSASHTATMTYSVTASTQSSTPSLSISTSSLPSASTGAGYSASLSAAGGNGAYSWALTSGALPSGLSLSSAGTITGTPTAAGNYSFTVQVSDGGSSTASRSLSIYVAQSAPASTTTSSTTTSTPSSSPGASTPSTTGSSGSGPSSTPASSGIAAFSISNMTATPVSSKNGNQYAISIKVANTGKAPGTKVLQLKINNNIEAQEEVVLDPGESRVVTFTVNKNTPGSYKASIDPLSTDFTVPESKNSQQISWDTADTIVWGIMIGGVLLVILLILLIIYRKHQSDYY